MLSILLRLNNIFMWFFYLFAFLFFLPLPTFAVDIISERLSIYGYSAFNFCISTKNKIGLGLPYECQSKGGSFAQALFAPFFEFEPFEKARFLSEIEMKYVPEFEIFGEIEAKKNQDKYEVEYDDKGAGKVLVEGFGEIDIAFAFFEYRFIDLLVFRAGRYLNPFGLYFEKRDAVPVYLFALLPSIYRKLPDIGTFIPLYNHGIQLRGELPFLGYVVQVANGRGSVANAIDRNADKAIGAHIFARVPGGKLTGSMIGGDFYTDKDFDNKRQTTFGGFALLSISEVGPGHLQLLGEMAYTRIAEVKAVAGYGLLGYSLTIQSFALTPYFITDGFAKIKAKVTNSIGGGLAFDYNTLRIKTQVLNVREKNGDSSIVFAFGIALAF